MLTIPEARASLLSQGARLKVARFRAVSRESGLHLQILIDILLPDGGQIAVIGRSFAEAMQLAAPQLARHGIALQFQRDRSCA